MRKQLLIVATAMIAFVLTDAPALAQVKKQLEVECFRDEDSPGGKLRCPGRVPTTGTQRIGSSGWGTQLVSKARQYLDMNARQIGLHRYTLWCSAFMRHIAGSPPGVNDWAVSWLSQRRTTARVGAIVVVRSARMHVGVVSGFDDAGNPIIISGNHDNRVAEVAYPRRSVVAWVEPPG